MKKNESKKAKTPASKPQAKTVAKASPAKPAVKAPAKKAAAKPAKAAPVKKAPVKAVAKPVAKPAPAKKAPVKAVAKPVAKPAPVKKAVAKAVAKPAAKAAPAKKALVKTVAKPAVKAAPAKKAVAKAAPAKKAPVKTVAKPAAKAAPAKKAPVKAVAKPAAKAAPAPQVQVKVVSKDAVSSKKKAVKNKEIPASHHGRVVTKAELMAFQNQTEANGHVIRKTHLSSKMKQHYRELLLNLRDSYLKQMNVHRDDALTNRKPGPSAGMATHMADLGSDNFQYDFELKLLSDEGTVIEMIDEALARLDNNEYGICLECGGEIGEARLEAKPYARFCVECKARKEDEGISHI